MNQNVLSVAVLSTVGFGNGITSDSAALNNDNATSVLALAGITENEHAVQAAKYVLGEVYRASDEIDASKVAATVAKRLKDYRARLNRGVANPPQATEQTQNAGQEQATEQTQNAGQEQATEQTQNDGQEQATEQTQNDGQEQGAAPVQLSDELQQTLNALNVEQLNALLSHAKVRIKALTGTGKSPGRPKLEKTAKDRVLEFLVPLFKGANPKEKGLRDKMIAAVRATMDDVATSSIAVYISQGFKDGLFNVEASTEASAEASEGQALAA